MRPRHAHPHGLRVMHVETGFVMPTTLSFFTWLVVTLVVAFCQVTELYTFALLCVLSFTIRNNNNNKDIFNLKKEPGAMYV